jgi:hypothetical protein
LVAVCVSLGAEGAVGGRIELLCHNFVGEDDVFAGVAKIRPDMAGFGWLTGTLEPLICAELSDLVALGGVAVVAPVGGWLIDLLGTKVVVSRAARAVLAGGALVTVRVIEAAVLDEGGKDARRGVALPKGDGPVEVPCPPKEVLGVAVEFFGKDAGALIGTGRGELGQKVGGLGRLHDGGDASGHDKEAA